LAHDFTCRDAAFVRYSRNSEHAGPYTGSRSRWSCRRRAASRQVRAGQARRGNPRVKVATGTPSRQRAASMMVVTNPAGEASARTPLARMLPRSVRRWRMAPGRCCRAGREAPRQGARRKVVERPGPATDNARGGGRNRMLARLPKAALVSNRKVLPSIGAFSRTMSAPGGRRHRRAGGFPAPVIDQPAFADRTLRIAQPGLASFHLDVRRPDDLGPLARKFNNKAAKVSR
jgi:hypothetical protein